MKNTELTRRIIRKCWMHIKDIKRSRNMVSVEGCIIQAIGDVYGTNQCGMHKIIARNNNALPKFEKHNAVRHYLTDLHKQEIKSFLSQFIPERFQTTTMYRNLFANL